MSKIRATLSTLLLLTTHKKSFASTSKQWLGNVEWTRPENWLNGVTPEDDSRVTFPLEMRHAVGMPRDDVAMRITGLELPRDGLVALPENGKIVINDHASNVNKLSRWSRETPYFWVDPLNWNTTSEAVPHLERLPCQSDLVILPSSYDTFSVRLPISRSIEVRGVKLSNDDFVMSRWIWRDMRNRPEFLGGAFTVKYSPTECKSCSCQEGDVSDYWEEICSVQRPRCELLACEYPLKIEGHCCFYCGGRIRVSEKTLLGTIERITDNALKKYKNNVYWHSRVAWNGELEILVTERDDYVGTDVVVAVVEVVAALRDESVDVLYSETSGNALRDYRLLFALGPLIGGLFALLALTLALCLFYDYTVAQIWDACRETSHAVTKLNGRKTKSWRESFGFARFENATEVNVRFADGNNDDSYSAETFENPLYGSVRQHHRRQQKRQKTTKNPETIAEQRAIVEVEEPVDLASLERAIELERMREEEEDDVDVNIENL